MKQLRTVLDKILSVLCGVSFLAMVLLTCWQVLTRYVLGNPSSWSEELVSYLFAWMALFGTSYVCSERGHMNIPILVDRFTGSAKKAFHIFSELVALVFAAVILLYGGVQITSLAMGQMTSSLGVAMGVFYVVLPLCGALNVIYSIINIIQIANGTLSLEVADEAAQAIEKAEKEV